MDSHSLLDKLEKHYSDFTSGHIKDVPEWAAEVKPLLNFFNSDLKYNFSSAINGYMMFAALGEKFVNSNLLKMKHALKSAIEELKLQITESGSLNRQEYFPSNKQLSIQITISSIIRKAESQLWVCDPYLDHLIIDELIDIQISEIKLLTGKPKNLFLSRLTAAKSELNYLSLEARSSDLLHDRFLVLDENVVWTLGTSFNVHAGNKPTTLVELVDATARNKMIIDFKKIWAASIQI
jgi:hypothetical protein